MSSANDTRRTVTQAPISLLETIARDADLRARLEADPSAVLAELGTDPKFSVEGDTKKDFQWLGLF